MEVPFLSSSAVSRAHYNLVQRMEATSPRDVDDILCREIDRLRRRLERRHPTPAERVESLVLLLYCATATMGRVTHAHLAFAVPHAVTLAEAGSTIKHKRIGAALINLRYLFCSEVMDPKDQLQIMLVNTLRKDLESSDVARICLALDTLIMNCPPDAIPAVTPRLVDLLSHDSPHVKRKILSVVQRVGLDNPEILAQATGKVHSRLRDSDPNVACIALRLLGTLTEVGLVRPDDALEYALNGFAPEVSTSSHRLHHPVSQLRLAEFVGRLADKALEPGATTLAIEALHQMLIRTNEKELALVLGIFRALSKYSTNELGSYFSSKESRAKEILCQLIGSKKPNNQYACLACLLALDPVLWAGTTEHIPATFDEIQVNIIMSLLDSPDNVLRKKTLQVLYRVDPPILSAHLSQLQSAIRMRPRQEQDYIIERIHEVAVELDTAGVVYASRLREISSIYPPVEGKTTTSSRGGASLVSENLVEKVLLHIRNCSPEFCADFVDTIARIPASDSGPTLTLIIAATICEYGGKSLIPQEDLLRGLASHLHRNPPAVQEAVLLAMLRVAARCESALPDVAGQVNALRGLSRNHIRYRCDQYLAFTERLESLKHVVRIAKSDTLPDFLSALENFERSPETFLREQQQPVSPDDALPRHHELGAKLRYEAYDPPRPPVARPIRRASSAASTAPSTTSSSHSADSISSSPRSRRHRRGQRGESAVSGDPSDEDEDVLSRTVTAGDLALAAHDSAFAAAAAAYQSKTRAQVQMDVKEKKKEKTLSPPTGNTTDLIALDSPFLADPSGEPTTESSTSPSSPPVVSQGSTRSVKDDVDVATTESRGWCDVSPQRVIQRIEALSKYHVRLSQDAGGGGGELLVVLSPLEQGGGQAELESSLRLIPGEEDSTLWKLRCSDVTIRADLRRLLHDA